MMRVAEISEAWRHNSIAVCRQPTHLIQLLFQQSRGSLNEQVLIAPQAFTHILNMQMRRNTNHQHVRLRNKVTFKVIKRLDTSLGTYFIEPVRAHIKSQDVIKPEPLQYP